MAWRAKMCVALMVNPDLLGEFHFNLEQKKRMSPQFHETVTYPHITVLNVSPRPAHEKLRRALAIAADLIRPPYVARLGRSCELTDALNCRRQSIRNSASLSVRTSPMKVRPVPEAEVPCTVSKSD